MLRRLDRCSAIVAGSAAVRSLGRSGQERAFPSAIFEDPFPYARQDIPGTGAPKQSPGSMFGGGGGHSPKVTFASCGMCLELQAPGKAGTAGLLQPRLGLAAIQSLSQPGNERQRTVGVHRPGRTRVWKKAKRSARTIQSPPGCVKCSACMPVRSSPKPEPSLKHTPLLQTGASERHDPG